MRILLLLMTFSLSGLILQGQSQLQQVIASSGGSGRSGSIAMEWTVGELVISTFSGGGVVLVQGFQPGSIFTAIRAVENLACRVEAYPNPTGDHVILSVDDPEIRNFHYLLYDLKGRLYKQVPMVCNPTVIDMDGYPAGIYLLKVIHSENGIKIIEIVKH